MKNVPFYIRGAGVLSIAALTVLHHTLTLRSWPLRTAAGTALMETPSAVLIAIVVVVLCLSTWRGSLPAVDTPSRLVGGTRVCVLGALFWLLGELALGEAGWLGGVLPGSVRHAAPPPLWYLFGAALVVAISGVLTGWWATRAKGVSQGSASWRLSDFSLGVLLALNIFFIALPEIRFVTGLEPPAASAGAPLTLFFGLQYADALAVNRNPLFDLVRWCLTPFTPAYFLTPMACVYLMALSLGLFCCALSHLVGRGAAFAAVSGLAWSKAVLLVVGTGTNIVTLFVAVAFAFWVLAWVSRVVSRGGIVSLILAGGLIGVALTLSLYTYAPSRVPCFLVSGFAALLLVWGALCDVSRRAGFVLEPASKLLRSDEVVTPHRIPQQQKLLRPVLALAMAAVAPAAVVLGEYGGDIAAFQRDFRGSVLPDISQIRTGRPDFIDPSLEAATPDLPITYGALITDVPQPDGSTKREWVYWRRSLGELAWVVSENLARIFRKYQPFPTGEVCWLLGCIGFAASLSRITGRARALLYGIAVLTAALICIAPFLVVPSPAEWRRGAAVVLVFASFGGVGLYWLIQLCAPRVRSEVVVSVVAVCAFVIFGRASLQAIASTPFAEVAIAMPCRTSYMRSLVTHARTELPRATTLYLLGSSTNQCLTSAAHQLSRSISGVRAEVLPFAGTSVKNLRDTLAPGDSVVIDCGDEGRGPIHNLCAELSTDPSAHLIYAAPHDGDSVWVVTQTPNPHIS